jgi:hypothetical protein
MFAIAPITNTHISTWQIYVSVAVMFSVSEYIVSTTFPMQNGMDIEIPLEITSKPTAPTNQK